MKARTRSPPRPAIGGKAKRTRVVTAPTRVVAAPVEHTQRRVDGDGKNCAYVLLPNVLSARQLAAARSFVASSEVQASLSEGERVTDHEQANDATDRRSRITWLERRPGEEADAPPKIPDWLHARLRAAARATHDELGDALCPIGADRHGRWRPRYEPVQYAEYDVGSHYSGWHTDAEADSADLEDVRSLTVVLMLSDSAAYAGGHLEVRLGGVHGKPSRVPLRAGDAVGFPAKHLWHRVTKCSAGLRQTMVFWASPAAELARAQRDERLAAESYPGDEGDDDA